MNKELDIEKLLNTQIVFKDQKDGQFKMIYYFHFINEIVNSARFSFFESELLQEIEAGDSKFSFPLRAFFEKKYEAEILRIDEDDYEENREKFTYLLFNPKYILDSINYMKSGKFEIEERQGELEKLKNSGCLLYIPLLIGLGVYLWW